MQESCDFFYNKGRKNAVCCGGGVAECHSGERKEERERREIDQAWSIYGGSKEPMPEYNSGEMNEDKDRKTGTGKMKRKRDR